MKIFLQARKIKFPIDFRKNFFAIDSWECFPLGTKIFLKFRIFLRSLPKPNPNLIFHFREKDQFQSAPSINLPHPLTSSLGSMGGNSLATSSSLHSLQQPSFEPFQPFKKWFISGYYIHATYSKWFISNTTWRMCTPLYMCLIVTLLNLEALIGPVSLLRFILRSATMCYGMISCYDTWFSSKLSHRLFCVSSIYRLSHER